MPRGLGSPGHVNEGYYSSFGSQRRPISQLAVSCEKEKCGAVPSSKPKRSDAMYNWRMHTLQSPCQSNPGSMFDSSGKAFYTTPQSTESLPGNPRKGEINSQRTKTD